MDTTLINNDLSTLLNSSSSSQKSRHGNWFEALSDAWGQTLDKEAAKLDDLSSQVSAGSDDPSTITELSTEAMRMSFMSNSSHTAIESAGDALKTMAQKS